MSARRQTVVVALVSLLVLAGCSSLSQPLGSGAATEEIRFENATESAGIDYHATGTGSGNGNSGAYATDVDNDGWTDLLIIGGESPALFVNTGGEFDRRAAFPKITADIKSAAVVDYDGDNWDDIVFFAVQDEPIVLHNEGGEFARTDIGIGNLTYPLGATTGDYDGDGDRDLFVYQSGRWSEHKPAGYSNVSARVGDDNGNRNVLYENTDDGFERVTDAGIEGHHWSLAASFVDLTGDGLPDIHIANDYNNDTVYINEGDGTFHRRTLGGATARNGMASEVADVNGDSAPDVFVTNIYLPLAENRDEMSEQRYARLERLFSHVIKSERTRGNTLLINRGDGTFVDRADEYGVRKGGWGWAASLTDLDNDGDRDLVQATQEVVRIDRDDPTWAYPMVWERAGESFSRVNKTTHGMDEHDGRGLVTLDYDHDGNREVVVVTYDGPVVVYDNTGGTGNSVAFEVVDDQGATALGATVRVEYGNETETVFQTDGNDFASQEPAVQHVGLGDAESATLVVTWPDGTERRFEVDANRRLRLSRDSAEVTTTYD